MKEIQQKVSKKQSMMKDSILLKADVQYKATFWHIKHQIVLESVVPMRLLEDSHKEPQLDKWKVKKEYKSAADEHWIFNFIWGEHWTKSAD